MVLWTIQPEEVYKSLMKDGVFRTEENLSLIGDIPEFKMQYDWLADKMKLIVGKAPAGVKYPIWAWHTWEGKRKRRDLRNNGYGNKGTRMVQLEIEIPDQDVLLTDFDLWVAILNGFNLNIESEDDFERDYYCLQTAEKSEHYTEYMEEIIKSWDKCIEPAGHNNMFMSEEKSIQATFWELKKEQVKKVWHFVCR